MSLDAYRRYGTKILVRADSVQPGCVCQILERICEDSAVRHIRALALDVGDLPWNVLAFRQEHGES
jgi:hypothetical protein